MATTGRPQKYSKNRPPLPGLLLSALGHTLPSVRTSFMDDPLARTQLRFQIRFQKIVYIYKLPISALTLVVGIWPVKSWVLVCWW